MAQVITAPNDASEKTPVYLQLAFKLETEIKSRFKPGEYLASENSLAERFQVNRHTVRRAIEQLIKAGIVIRQQGKGTQVVSNQIEYLLNPSGTFTKNLNELGKAAHAVLLNKRVVPLEQVPVAIGRYFQGEGGDIVELTTLRFMENVSVCLIRHYLLSDALPEIAEHYRGGSLHQHIGEKYGINLQRSQINVSATLANANEAMQLKCAIDSPLVVLQSVNRIAPKGRVVEVSVSHSRPDRLQYQIDFTGNDL